MRAIEACGYIMYFFESDYVALMMAQSSLEEYVLYRKPGSPFFANMANTFISYGVTLTYV